MLPRLADLSIPQSVQADPATWGEQMLEMADHIGPYHTLVIHERFGGQFVKVSTDPDLNPFRSVLGGDLARHFTSIYAGTRLQLAAARTQIMKAKRAGVIAAVRAGTLSGADAAVVIGTSRTYLAHLVNETDEGVGVAPITLPLSREAALLQTAVHLIEATLLAVAAPACLIDIIRERVLGLGAADSDILRRVVDEYRSPTTGATAEAVLSLVGLSDADRQAAQ